jgi:predicted DsbA family dithiol-disulfide isomerase
LAFKAQFTFALSHRDHGLAAQKCLLEEIYSDHFERNADITSIRALAEAAAAVGLELKKCGNSWTMEGTQMRSMSWLLG